jgi:acylglycerol lipase
MDAQITTTEERVDTVGGLKLFLRTWRPGAKPRGVAVIVHGLNSYGGEYEGVAKQLVAQGLVVYAPDLRGRGKSEGERFFVERFGDWVDDAALIVKLAKSRDAALPVFLLGHSAGGVVAGTYALDHQSELAGLICESFALELPAPGVVLALLKGLSRISPHLRILSLKNQDFSRDPAVVAAKNSDPLIAHESQPVQTLAELIRAGERLKREVSRITLPVLILHGTVDKATSPHGSRYFHEHVGSSDRTLKLYDGYVHDLLHDVGREIVMADLVAWLGPRLQSAG